MSFLQTEEYHEGYLARELTGASILDNPYAPDPRASSPYRQWTRGWMAADKALEVDEGGDDQDG